MRQLISAINEWQKLHVTIYAAALAYYAIFSIVPLIIIALLFTQNLYVGAEQLVRREIAQVLTESGAEVVDQVMAPTEISFGFPTFIAILALIFGASGLFRNLRVALNIIFGVESRGLSIIQILKNQLKPFLMVLIWGSAMTFLVLANSSVAAFSKYLPPSVPLPALSQRLISQGLTFISLAIFFCILYRILPQKKLPWNALWTGSFIGAFLFIAGASIINFILARVDIVSVYGGASTLLAVMVWSYYSANVFLFGAVYAKVKAR